MGDPIGLVWGRAQSYFVFGKRVCELEAFIGITGGMGRLWGGLGGCRVCRISMGSVILMGFFPLGG